MRCLVTGATGMIGSHLVRLLVAIGCETAVLIRPNSNPWRVADLLSRLHVIEGSLENIAGIEPDLQHFAPEAVFHLGWTGVSGGLRNDPSNVLANLNASVHLLQSSACAGCRVWVGLGSQAEYGRYDGILRDHTPVNPETIYGVTKLCAGLLTRRLCDDFGVRYVWLRLLSAYGPMDNPEYLVPYTVISLLRGRKPSLTPGEHRLDYLYVGDTAAAIWEAASNPGVSGVFNLGSGEAHSVRDIAERIRDLIDPSLELGLGDLPYRPGQVMRLQADISPLTKAIGWSPKVSLDDGLRMTVQWYQDHPSSPGA
ncbi:MAG: NAD-dependent epimerase/dehydratase family protein [Chloroflexota bacterium]